MRDPDVRHQLARTYRQGWSVYRRVLRTRAGDDALLEARQWEADHFEDVPGHRRRLRPRAAGRCSRRSARPSFYARRVPGGAEPAPRRGRARASAAPASTLALWSRWEARRTLGLPAAVTPVVVVPLGRPRGVPAPAPVAPVGNLVHLDRYGHQPFRGRARR